MDAIALTLRRYRRENKLTQQKLADQLKVSSKSVSNWENQKEPPRRDNIEQIIKVLALSKEDQLQLFSGPTPDERLAQMAPDDEDVDELIADLKAAAQKDTTRLSALRALLASWLGGARPDQ